MPSATTWRRVELADLRAGLWTLVATLRTRRRLRRGGLDGALPAPAPPALPASAERGVDALLRRTRASCVERAIVRQAWHAAHGERRDLVVGVRPPGDAELAHAWLDGDPPHGEQPFGELLRRPAP